jgi:DNA-formamidopyrimidine glycosylase
MPEGPEVKNTARCLNSTASSFYLLKINSNIDKIPSFKGCLYIHKVVSYGKKIIFVFNDKYLVSSLGMEGKWRFDPAGLKHVRCTLTLGQKKGRFIVPCKTLYYDDSRMFGSLNFHQDLSFVNKLGPDVLKYQIEEKEFIPLFPMKKTIAQALLDQSIIAGIGNYLKCDILYESKVAPSRLCSSLTPKEWSNIYKACYSLPRESYEKNGLTIRTYLTPDLVKGNYNTRVYGRDTDDQGNKVIKEKSKDGRSTYWCPDVQK